MARAMKDSGIDWIGQIPENWEILRNKNCFNCSKKIIGQEFKNTQLLSLTTKGVKKKDINNTAGKTPDSYETYQKVEPNQIVMCLFDLDCSAVFSGMSKFSGMISPAYDILECKENFLPDYFNYWFSFVAYDRKFKSYAKNLRFTLKYTEFSCLPIIVPPYHEQKKIAAFLDDKCAAIDEIITKTEQSIEEYKKLKQAVITKAVTQGIRPNRTMKNSGIDWIGKIPVDWDVRKLRYLYKCQNGISKSADFFGHGFPFVSYKDVYDNDELPVSVSGLCNTTEEERDRYSVKRGDIFFTRTSETIEEIGLTSICLNTIENATFAGFLIRCRPYTSKLDFNYAKYYMISSHLRLYFVKEMNLVIRASLSQELLKDLCILIPSPEEQKEIADYLDMKCTEIDALIEKKQQSLTELASYKKSLIYEYVTGKKEVD